MSQEDFIAGVLITTALVIIFALIILQTSVVMHKYEFEITGGKFCESYGLLYSNWEHINENDISKGFRFVCINSTAEKVDTIGIMRVK